MAVLFRNVEELFTLEGAVRKKGRHIADADLSVLSRAALMVEKDRIVWFGPNRLVPRRLAKQKIQEINCQGFSIFPAFLECHTHLVFAGNRNHEYEMRQQGMTYQQIAESGGGILSTVKATRRATEPQLLKLAQTRMNDFLRQGVTVCEVKSGYGLNQKDELKMLRVAGKLKGPDVVRTFLGAHSRSPETPSLDAYIDQMCEKTLSLIKKKKLAERVDIFIEKGFYEIRHAEKLYKKAHDLGLDFVVHSEQLSNSGSCSWGVKNGVRSVDHIVELTTDDVSRLAESETTGVLLPAADFYLKIPYPPARKLLSIGARLALATDFNPGTSPTQDLSFVGFLARHEMKMSWSEVFVAYTLNAAYALGREEELGSISVGKRADFFVSDSGRNDFFYQVGHHPVRQVWKAGKRVF